ncbi:haloacid dehalogenase type II [Marinomonas agarivorans]|nr:haloacid dehalogenase type II [Marinomonas agarivorans]
MMQIPASITRDALYFTNTKLQTELTEETMSALLVTMARSPAYPEAKQALAKLQGQEGYSLYAFSNGEADRVSATLANADLLTILKEVISVESVQSFKPDPRVYQHLCTCVDLPAHEVMLVSSNPFDIIGASAFGIQTAWIKRSARVVFDEWETKPDYELTSLLDLVTL